MVDEGRFGEEKAPKVGRGGEKRREREREEKRRREKLFVLVRFTHPTILETKGGKSRTI